MLGWVGTVGIYLTKGHVVEDWVDVKAVANPVPGRLRHHLTDTLVAHLAASCADVGKSGGGGMCTPSTVAVVVSELVAAVRR